MSNLLPPKLQSSDQLAIKLEIIIYLDAFSSAKSEFFVIIKDRIKVFYPVRIYWSIKYDPISPFRSVLGTYSHSMSHDPIMPIFAYLIMIAH